MGHGPLQPVLRYLRRVLGPEGEPGRSDAQLLDQFVSSHDATAFELLVWRHGTMVWSVCRRLLPDAASAEDAFQATFLVLVRKADSIGKREAVGSWLHRVASRVALRARCTGARRAVREQTGIDLQQIAAEAPPRDPADCELPSILTEELSQLPEKYRAPVVLCYLEGKGYDEAARQLGCPKGTLSTRLTRARMLLRNRLARRGFAVPAALLAAELAAKAAVPDTLVQTTMQAARLSAAENTLAGFSTQAVALAQGVIHTMFLTRLKLTAGFLVLLSLIGSGAGVLGHHVLAADVHGKARKDGEPHPKPVLAADAWQRAHVVDKTDCRLCHKSLAFPGDEVDQLQRENFRLRNRLQLLEKEVEWLRQDLDRLKATQAEGIRLRWHFEKGKPFFQEMTTVTEQAMKVQNNDVKQVQTQTWLFRWTPLEQGADNSWTFRLEIERVAVDIDIGQQKIAFDSSKPQAQGNNPLAEFYRALKDAEFTITLNTRDMKVTRVEGSKALLDKLSQANPQMRPLLAQILKEKALIEMTEPIFAVLPGKDVRKGDTWKRESTLDMGPTGKCQNSHTYTYEGLEGKLDKVKIDTTVQIKEQDDPAEELPFRIQQSKINSKGSGGVFWFDRQRGRLDRLELNLRFEGKLVITIGGQGTPVDLSQTQKTTIKVTDAPGPGK